MVNICRCILASVIQSCNFFVQHIFYKRKFCWPKMESQLVFNLYRCWGKLHQYYRLLWSRKVIAGHVLPCKSYRFCTEKNIPRFCTGKVGLNLISLSCIVSLFRVIETLSPPSRRAMLGCSSEWTSFGTLPGHNSAGHSHTHSLAPSQKGTQILHLEGGQIHLI